MKNVVITGSTRGIGLAMAQAFWQAGCRVTLSGRGGELPQAAREAFVSDPDRVLYVSCDVRDKVSLKNLWTVSRDRWGSVDIWINNAGQNTAYRPCWETGEPDTVAVIQTNLTGMIFGSQVAAEGMFQQGYGAIYSMEGLGSNNMIQPKTILYGTSKHALTYFMKGLARELAGTGVIAGRLSPGMMLTDFITKTPDGEPAAVLKDASFRRVFNILADKPETVARFFIPKILANTRNDVQIAWLTPARAAWRFMTSFWRKNRLL
ncbi:MAG: SDR family oxidoreductase [Clostridiaceae bacterium]|jgi:NAD(P)-dependent dehydrogenase (short-subunit alcohol dehydrogenase family)|nr:SDR family oxidoreductase [Clostridiaceae bacterium]